MFFKRIKCLKNNEYFNVIWKKSLNIVRQNIAYLNFLKILNK